MKMKTKNDCVVEQVAQRYKKLVNSIKGNNENMLSYDADIGRWYIEAVNTSGCVLLGEVEGKIQVDSDILENALDKFKEAIDKYNNQRKLNEDSQKRW